MLDPAPELSPISAVPPPETPDPAPEGHGPRGVLRIERIGALIEVLLCSGLPTQLLIFGALTGFGMSPRTEDGGWHPPFVIVMSLLDMVLVIGLVVVFLRAHGESFRSFLTGPRMPGKEALLGLTLVPAAFALVIVVFAAILAVEPDLNNVEVNPFQRMLQTPGDAAIFAFVVTFAGGVREEIQRGFIIRRFDRYLGGAVAGIVIYAGVFGLGHLEQGYAAAIATGVLGAFWGIVYWKRQSVIAPMVSHAGFNLAQLLKFVTLAAGAR